jgi:hypothetical protein
LRLAASFEGKQTKPVQVPQCEDKAQKASALARRQTILRSAAITADATRICRVFTFTMYQ